MKYVFCCMSILFGVVTLFSLILFIYGCYFYTTEIPIVLPGTTDYIYAEDSLWGKNVFPIIIALISYLLFVWFNSLYHKLNLKKKINQNENIPNGPFSLYLRSFMADAKTREPVSIINDCRTEEEALVSVMSDIATVYAIGDPNDKKIPHGASRIYVDDKQWKSTVEILSKQATFVALRLGKTDSFWWEVEMVLEKIPIEKILFIVPQSKTFNNIANLYEILLRHGVNIKELNISIAKKRRGSISSFIYFDKERNPVVSDVKIPRLTKFVISYSDVLRNSLAGFREKFGLQKRKYQSYRIARILSLAILASGFVVASSKMFSDIIELKYQMPYELVEECTQFSSFTEKYSNEINGDNLCYCIIESSIGIFALDDEDFIRVLQIEMGTMEKISEEEFSQLKDAPKNLLLMVKKYQPDKYNQYIKILSKAALLSLESPEQIIEEYKRYQSNAKYLPNWVYEDLNCENKGLTELEDLKRRHVVILNHIRDENIAEVCKTILSYDRDLSKIMVN